MHSLRATTGTTTASASSSAVGIRKLAMLAGRAAKPILGCDRAGGEAPHLYAVGASHFASSACHRTGILRIVTGQGHRGFAIMLRLLRVMGLLIAATLAWPAAHAARAEARPTDGCKRATFRVIIDVGHTEKSPGAISARGVTEFVFNLNLAKRIEQQLLAAGFRRS